MEELAPFTKIDPLHVDSLVVFTISECSEDKDYSFYRIEPQEAKAFLARLTTLEQLTWAQLSNTGRTQYGFTCEKPGSESEALIDEQCRHISKLTQRRYFHFRVKDGSLFRIFGYQRDNLFCITHLDRKGKIHH